MKKIFAVLLAVVLLMVPITMTAHAEEYVDFTAGYHDTQTEISYHAYSTYTVTVPAYMDYGTQHEIWVDTTNVETGYQVKAYVTNTDENGLITITSDTGAEGKVGLYFDGVPYTYQTSGYFHSFEPGGGGYCVVMFDCVNGFRPTSVGMYYGVICFRFDCVPV